MHEQSPQDKEAAFKVTVFASISLTIMMAEYVWLVRDEFKYVWPRLCWTWTAWIYVFTRYLGLASQIYNLYFAVRMYLGVHSSTAGCRFWFMFQAIVVQVLLASVEGLLMRRVYALFLGSRVILLILILFIVGQMVSMFVSAKLSFPTNEYTPTCFMVRSNPGGAFFSATTMTTNVVIFVMTFFRYLRLPAKWTRVGMGKIVFRDSALSLGAISIMMLFLTLCSLDVIKPHTSGNSTYYWLVAILWISIGRITLNHEKVRRELNEESEGTWDGTLQITSQMEIGEHTLTKKSADATSNRSTPSSELGSSSSASVSKASQQSSLSSTRGQKWLGDHPHLDEPRRGPRPKVQSRVGPVLYLDIQLPRESEIAPWSDYMNDGAAEDDVKPGVVLPSGEGVNDEPQTQDITDAWRENDEVANGLGSPELSPLELPPADAVVMN